MKSKALLILVVVILILIPNVNFGQTAPALGTTSSFALFTAGGAFNVTGASTVTGNVGTNVGAFNGFPPGTLIGNKYVADPTSAQAATDVAVAYSNLTQGGTVIGVGLGNGQTLLPGVYQTGAASTLNGNLILDGNGNPNSLFIIRIGGAFATGASSTVTLINSASVCNVYWQIGGQFDLETGSVFRGTLVVDGPIHLLGNSSLLGRGLSKAGEISLANNIVTNPCSCVAYATPTFTQVGPLCQNATTPASLPTSSTNTTPITGTWSPAFSTATIGTTKYTFTPAAGQCATTATMDVVITTQITPTFTQVGPLCQNATTPASLPTSSTNTTPITGTWSPAFSTATIGTTKYTFTPAAGQCATTATMDVVITTQITPTFTQVGPLCQNATTPASLPTSSTNTTPITGTWSPAFSTATIGTTKYTFTPAAGQCATTATMDVVITTQITPTFTQVGPLCQNATTPASLPTSSTNTTPITGTWSPAFSTATLGTTKYTFTPAAGQCATTATMDVVITTQITPTFTQVGPLCQNATTPVSLPTSSTNTTPITGAWSPAFSTATVGTTKYTFTPAAGQCATTVTMDVVITTQITPTFTQVGPLCQNATTPASLPTSSTNTTPITGAWSPAFSTATIGTTKYTFTPAAGQCATTATMDVVITTQITPTFTQVGPLCQNATTPASLPTSSTNTTPITGTWSPAFSTATLGTTKYTFTPAAGQCATTATMDVVITTQITPTFTQVGPLCQNATTPASLPTSSTNTTPITGTWSPAFSTATLGTTKYTFTPAAGQCATTATMDVVITTQITPTFTQVGPLCQNATTPASLPTSSTNTTPITGTWSPAFSTATLGTTKYTFTPAAGQCATTATMDVVITTQITPTFTQVGPLCQNATTPVSLPTSSTNTTPITGAWSPAFSTATVGTTKYTFTPAAGQCATTVTMDVVITTQITPTFTQVGPLCQNATTPASLPTSSTNTTPITGTWSPAFSTATLGTTKYTFTPAAGQCATTVTMDVVITTQITPTFTQVGPLCQNATTPASLPTSSTNTTPITGTWSPAFSTATIGTTKYTFTPAAGQCAGTATMDVVITTQIIPTFTQVGPLCQNATTPASLPTSSTNTTPITGTWSPAFSTATLGKTKYTFTPAAGQCAATATMDVVITTQITTTFTQVGPLCQNATTPASLPTSSTNTTPITGTWSPAFSTATVGTTKYTFTPAVGQCAGTATMDVVITTQITPTFTQVGPLCQNATTPASLPTSSTNTTPITGTWSPAFSTATVGTTRYTFTPAAGQCAGTATMDVVITTQITPTFTQVGPLCQNATTPASLPTSSTNTTPITGTWSPAFSTATVGTKKYTFTPAAGQCAGTATMDVVITTQITPTFTQIGPLCQNSAAPVLLTTSINGITGTWSPLTINTAAIGSINYKFTPTGSCAVPVTMNIVITAVPAAPTLGSITQPTCEVATGSKVLNGLPKTGIWTLNPGGITGTGTSKTISGLAPGTYSYTVTNAEGCTSAASASFVIDALPSTPSAPTLVSVTQPTCEVPTGSKVLGGLPKTGTWTLNPGGITGTGTSKTITGLAPGTYSYTVTNEEGCTSAASASFVIDALPSTPSAPTLVSVTQPTCEVPTGSKVLGGLPKTGTWTLNPGGITGTGTSKTITGLAPGTYSYTVTNEEGCTSAASASFVIDALPATPSAPTLGLITQPTCIISTGSLVLNGLPATGTWTLNPGGITGTGTSKTITGLAPGTYSYTVTNAEGCTSAVSVSFIIDAQPPIPAAPTVTLIQTTCLVPTGTIIVTAPTGTGMTYSIDGSTYTNTTGIFTLLPPGTYVVTAKNADGCISSR